MPGHQIGQLGGALASLPDQLSLSATSTPVEEYNFNFGSASAPCTPKPLSVGPTARRSTRFGLVPEIANPVINEREPSPSPNG